MLWQLILTMTLVWLLVLRWQNRGKRQMAKCFKNEINSLPLLGISHLFIGSNEDRMNTLKNIAYDSIKQGGISSYWLAHRFFTVIVDPVEAEMVLKNCLEKDDILKFVRKLTGNGSIFAPVPLWRPRRKILALSFGLRNLNQFVTIFSEQGRIIVDRLAEATDKGTFSIWKYMTSCTMDAVCQTTMGMKLGIQQREDHPFLKQFEKFGELVSERTLSPWLHSDFMYWLTTNHKSFMETKDYLTNFVTKIIKEKCLSIRSKENNKNDVDEQSSTKNKHFDTNNYTTKSFLELLIEYSRRDEGYTDLELREETMVMLLAGTDTSAVGASFTTVMLSKHPEIQEKVYKELIEVLGDEDRLITAEDLTRFKYLEAVIKETLRLYPPVPMTARVTDKDVILPSGRKIVKDVGVVIHIWGMHRNPKYWGSDAEVFRPERFFDLQLEHPAAYMPFSYGPRNCLGYQYAMMSMKTILASIVKRYKILPAEYIIADGDNPLRVKYDIMMKHVDKFQVQLVHRKEFIDIPRA